MECGCIQSRNFIRNVFLFSKREVEKKILVGKFTDVKMKKCIECGLVLLSSMPSYHAATNVPFAKARYALSHNKW